MNYFDIVQTFFKNQDYFSHQVYIMLDFMHNLGDQTPELSTFTQGYAQVSTYFLWKPASAFLNSNKISTFFTDAHGLTVVQHPFHMI